MSFVLLLSILMAPFSFADVGPAHCVKLETEVSGWTKGAAEVNKVVLTDAQLVRSEAIFAEIKGLAKADGAKLMKALSSDFNKVFAKFAVSANDDCPSVRLKVSRALLSTAAAPGASEANKAKIRSMLKSSLATERFPMLFNSAVQVTTLAEGLKSEIWKLAAADQARLSTLEEDLKRHIKEFTPSDELVKELEKLTALPEKERVSFVEKSTVLQKSKPTLIKETQASNALLESTKQISARLTP